MNAAREMECGLKNFRRSRLSSNACRAEAHAQVDLISSGNAGQEYLAVAHASGVIPQLR